MSDQAHIVSVNRSKKTGTVKTPVEEIVLTANGIKGDAHAGSWHRQVSLLSKELIDQFSESHDRPVKPGEFAENITTQGLDLRTVAPFDRLRFGDVELEVTQIGKHCHGDTCAIFREIGACVMPKEGIFARVLTEGTITADMAIEHVAQPLKIRIVTLSDRASRGEYPDRSGPLALDLLVKHFDGARWQPETTAATLPDDVDKLRAELQSARDAGVSVLVTTGSTGLGPRDIAPETVAALCDKTFSGVMDRVRMQAGEKNPNALLSRAIAGTMDTMLVYAIPGSPRAVQEYMTEILRTLDHAMFMVRGIDAH